MTLQLIPLLLSPALFVINVYAIVIGFRGSTRLHKLSRAFGIGGVCLFFIAALAVIDLITQVWVMRAGSISVKLYLVSGVAFIVCTAFSLALIVKARRT
jgi:hypothetical protein